MRRCLLPVTAWVRLDGSKATCECALEEGHAPPCVCRHHLKDLAYRAKKAAQPDKRQWKENGTG